MKLIKHLRFIILLLIILVILVIIRLNRRNYFKLTADEAHIISLDSSFYLSQEGLQGLNKDYILVKLDSAKYENNLLAGAQQIELGNLLKRPSIKLYGKHNIVIISDDMSKSVKAKSILNQMGYKNIFILDLLNNEAFKYKFQPDKVKLE